MRKKLAYSALAAATAAAALLPAAPAAASCTKPTGYEIVQCVERPICEVGYKLGFQCVD